MPPKREQVDLVAGDEPVDARRESGEAMVPSGTP